MFSRAWQALNQGASALLNVFTPRAMFSRAWYEFHVFLTLVHYVLFLPLVSPFSRTFRWLHILGFEL